jgi:hypothetical protein
MLHSDRYQHPDRFAAAVKLQAKHQDDHRIVAVKGKSEFEMFGFEGTLHGCSVDLRNVLNPYHRPWKSSKRIHGSLRQQQSGLGAGNGHCEA